MLGSFALFSFLLLIFFFKIAFSKDSYTNTVRNLQVSNSLQLDHNNSISLCQGILSFKIVEEPICGP